MNVSLRTFWLRLSAVFALLFGWACVGCGPAGPTVFPVKGQVQLVGGDSGPLVGHLIEVADSRDQTIRSSGEIHADGNFELESLIQGEVRKGALQGNYLARIVLSDDDPQRRKTAAAAINPRFLKFETSGLSFSVPSSSPVQLQVSRQ
jgi:hypothetical protein